MPAYFVPCAACSRHVRSDESKCPFCDAVLASSPLCTDVEEAQTQGRSRAALLALTVALVGGATLGGCFVSPPYGAPVDIQSQDAVADGTRGD